MVLKLIKTFQLLFRVFESDVISDGTQTILRHIRHNEPFESDVISDGTQTQNFKNLYQRLFESDVISDGTQTHPQPLYIV